MSWSFGHEGTWNEVMEKITRAALTLENYKPEHRATAQGHFENFRKASWAEMQAIHDEMMQKPGEPTGVKWSMNGHWDPQNRSGSMSIARVTLKPVEKDPAKTVAKAKAVEEPAPVGAAK